MKIWYIVDKLPLDNVGDELAFAMDVRSTNSEIEKVSQISTELKFIVRKPQSSYMADIPEANKFTWEIRLFCNSPILA